MQRVCRLRLDGNVVGLRTRMSYHDLADHTTSVVACRVFVAVSRSRDKNDSCFRIQIEWKYQSGEQCFYKAHRLSFHCVKRVRTTPRCAGRKCGFCGLPPVIWHVPVIDTPVSPSSGARHPLRCLQRLSSLMPWLLLKRSVVEQPQAGECHGDAVRFNRFDDLAVTNAAAGLTNDTRANNSAHNVQCKQAAYFMTKHVQQQASISTGTLCGAQS